MSSFGLVTFLFLIGVETDTDLIVKNWKSVILITIPPFAASFAVSVGVAKLIYDTLTSQDVPFTTFFIFVGTVMAVTSLSVLSRVLAEMGLLTSRLGATTVAAGAANDTLGCVWMPCTEKRPRMLTIVHATLHSYCLLAVASSLAGGGKQINALYQLLCFLAYLLVLIFIWRPILFWLIKRQGIDLSPDSNDYVPRWLILIGILGGLFSACMSDMFGLHQLVGAFAYGVVIPHGRYGIAVTEAVETPIVYLLLPLYFGAVGLQIDFTKLDTGVTWGLTVLLIAAIFITKAGTTTLFSRVAGLDWRQAMCVGALMQSKGVIEVVIGSVALSSGVIDTRIFSMLFFTFLFTTCTVRPLARAIYLKQAESERVAADAQTDKLSMAEKRSLHDEPSQTQTALGQQQTMLGITFALSSPNPSLGGLMTLMGLVGHPPGVTSAVTPATVALDILRILPLEYGPASILRLVFSSDQKHDGLLESLKTIAMFKSVRSSRSLLSRPSQDVRVSDWTRSDQDGETLTVPDSQMIPTILQSHRRALLRCADTLTVGDKSTSVVDGLVICPWEAPAHVAHSQSLFSSLMPSSATDAGVDSRLWRASADAQAVPARLFRQHQIATGVLVDSSALASVTRGRARRQQPRRSPLERLLQLSQPGVPRKPRVVVPFFGGADDRSAVGLARTLAEASSGRIDVIIVAYQDVEVLAGEADGSDQDVDGHTPAADVLSALQSAVATSQAEPEQEDQETINLKTIHQPEARQADARFLFQTVGVQNDTIEEEEPRAASSPSPAPTPVPADHDAPSVRVVGGIRLVSLSRKDSTVEGLLTATSSLLDRRRPSDLLIIGRGKQGSRAASFRADIDSLRQRAQDGDGQAATTWRISREEADEIRAMGRTLGAAAEGALVFGLSAGDGAEGGASMLVVQAATGR